MPLLLDVDVDVGGLGQGETGKTKGGRLGDRLSLGNLPAPADVETLAKQLAGGRGVGRGDDAAVGARQVQPLVVGGPRGQPAQSPRGRRRVGTRGAAQRSSSGMPIPLRSG